MYRPLIDQYKSMHLELTTRCTLGCPACSRTIFANQLNRSYPKVDIDLDQLFSFFDCDAGRNIERFTLCGDYGDAIYYPKLIEFIKRFRSTKKFTLITNGSHRSSKFWKELTQLLTSDDTITFGIDGLSDTNHLYRVNADWDSIMIGLDIAVASSAKVKWDTNIFNFNYNRIDEIKKFAESRGAEFVAKKTARFGDESLRPPEQYINAEEIFNKKYIDSTVDIDPKCYRKRSISATGQFNPCGWISAPQTYYKTNLYRDRKLWSIYNNTLEQILDRLDKWATEIKQDPEVAHVICKMKCKPDQASRIYYDNTKSKD
jgi:MoaA/NifB/PqqE/SkfB family radical SAM enzyme